MIRSESRKLIDLASGFVANLENLKNLEIEACFSHVRKKIRGKSSILGKIRENSGKTFPPVDKSQYVNNWDSFACSYF